MSNTVEETWKDVKEYERLYQVSDKGNVRSIRNNKMKLLKPCVDRYGYLYVNLCKEGIHISFKIHKLVLLIFDRNPTGKEQCNHVDGDKHNNNISNLEWITPSENIRHAFRLGLRSVVREKHPMYGKHHSTNAKAKMSECRKEEKNPMYGKHHTHKTKEKLRGENSSQSKLVVREVIQIKMLFKLGTRSQQWIANHYKVSHQTISVIKYGKCWSHITV